MSTNKKMTLLDLRNELLKCDDNPIKSLIIQKMIKLKQLDKKYDNKINMELEETLNNLISDENKYKVKDNIVNIDAKSLYEIERIERNDNKKIPIERQNTTNIDKDKMNNTLMARMSNDVDIRKNFQKEKL